MAHWLHQVAFPGRKAATTKDRLSVPMAIWPRLSHPHRQLLPRRKRERWMEPSPQARKHK